MSLGDQCGRGACEVHGRHGREGPGVPAVRIGQDDQNGVGGLCLLLVVGKGGVEVLRQIAVVRQVQNECAPLGVWDLLGARLVPVQDQPADLLPGHPRLAQRMQRGGAPSRAGLPAQHQDVALAVGAAEHTDGLRHLAGSLRPGGIDERVFREVQFAVVDTGAAQVLPAPDVLVVVLFVVAGDLRHLCLAGRFDLLLHRCGALGVGHDCSWLGM